MVWQITPRLSLSEAAVEEVFVRASGPGGQNVNKVASAVQLRVKLVESGLPAAVLQRLSDAAGRRVSKDGVLVLTAQKHRTQELNRAEAMARLINLLREAAKPVKVRRATKPTYGSVVRRREGKQQQARKKAGRGKVAAD